MSTHQDQMEASNGILFRGMTYSDNRELEGRIFHIAKEFQVPLFEKDVAAEKKIENLYRVSVPAHPSVSLLYSPRPRTPPLALSSDRPQHILFV